MTIFVTIRLGFLCYNMNELYGEFYGIMISLSKRFWTWYWFGIDLVLISYLYIDEKWYCFVCIGNLPSVVVIL